MPWIEALRDKSKFVLGAGEDPMRPSDFTEMVEAMFSKGKIEGRRFTTVLTTAVRSADVPGPAKGLENCMKLGTTRRLPALRGRNTIATQNNPNKKIFIGVIVAVVAVGAWAAFRPGAPLYQ